MRVKLGSARAGVAAIMSLLFIVGSAQLATGAHGGSWSHHHLHLFEQGTSQYGSYGDVNAVDNSYGYGYVEWFRLSSSGGQILDGESVWCTSSCSYRKTFTKYFAQTAYKLQSIACAKAGQHTLSGQQGSIFECQSYQSLQLPHHIHTKNTN